MLAVVRLQMPVSAEHETVVALNLSRVSTDPLPDLLDREPQRVSAVTLGTTFTWTRPSLSGCRRQNLAGSASGPFSLFYGLRAVALIQFDLSTKKSLGIFSMTSEY